MSDQSRTHEPIFRDGEHPTFIHPWPVGIHSLGRPYVVFILSKNGPAGQKAETFVEILRENGASWGVDPRNGHGGE